MQTSVNKYVWIDSFMYTNIVKQKAKDSIQGGDPPKSGLEYVLFEIEINPSLETQPWANISNCSVPRDKEEILFSPATLFKIESVHRNEEVNSSNTKYNIQMKLSSLKDDKLNDLSSYLKQNIESEANLETLCSLIIQTGQLHQAKDYYHHIIKAPSSDNELRMICCKCLGNIYYKRQEFQIAVNNFNKQEFHNALNNYSKKEPRNAINNYKKQKLQKAIKYYSDAIKLTNSVKYRSNLKAKCCMSLADAYKRCDKTEDALQYYEIALKCFEKDKPCLDAASCFSKIGSICEEKHANGEANANDKASEAFTKAVEGIKKIQSDDPLYKIQLLENESALYRNQCNLEKAIECLNKDALKISTKYFTANDPKIARLHRRIGDLYLDYGDIVSALTSYHKAAEIYYNADLVEDDCYESVKHLIRRCDVLLK
ncbi:unnamed protein product [Rotaria socialis]|uniref:Uncharacterized protein n=2 Tax=Rotaria socialis TaxID=392032 RepID=A0A818WIV5_9BILA|nr:unnamed protein product [Rotaria socialis]